MSSINPFHDLLAQQGIMPMEAMSWNKQNAKSIQIGLPKESAPYENRIGLTPQAVQLLCNNGHEICIEQGAGEGAGFADSAYLLAGAQVTNDIDHIWKCQVVIKLDAPSREEIARMQEGHTIISSASKHQISPTLIDAMNKKKIMSIGLEYVEDNEGGYPFVKMMAEIAGQLILPIATNILSNKKGPGVLVGNITGVPPVNMVILGSGQIVEQVAKAAWQAGILVHVFDKDIYKLQRLKTRLGFPLITQVIDSENLPMALQSAQIIVGALRSESGITSCVVTEEMVSKLHADTLIIDVSIDQGGCFETSEICDLGNPTFRKYGITHYCVPNIPSMVSQTASLALSNVLTSFLLKAGKTGGIEEMLWQGKSFMKGIYCYRGYVTHPVVGKMLNKPVKDIQLLLLSRG